MGDRMARKFRKHIGAPDDFRPEPPPHRARPDGEWAVRVYHKPFVGWIWGGCLIMALGGLLAASDRRYRLPARRTAADSTASEVSA